MNAEKKLSPATLAFALAFGIAGSGAVWANHPEHAVAQDRPVAEAKAGYVDTAFGQALRSYAARAGIERAIVDPQIVYVDQAYGQAIYGYPRVARDRVAALNFYYVDTAYGQAIYSYPGAGDARGVEVDVLPMLPY